MLEMGDSIDKLRQVGYDLLLMACQVLEFLYEAMGEESGLKHEMMAIQMEILGEKETVQVW